MSRNLTGPPYTEAEMATSRARLSKPDPDNVEALADAVNRFHDRLDLELEVKADVTRQFAHNMLTNAMVVVHYEKDGAA